ncbi:MAG: hypothetical protein A2285_06535 [Elusimicrobia bacterium RIFOXYA12_FULL_57_11]|nr:MAG: hypothetical protein A2285_06535 [Elusimicrobia bacterium RIFOXYA12_FULL_57_11]
MKYSVIIPVRNEENSVVPVYLAVSEVMGRLPGTHEIIFIDDASTDCGVLRLKAVQGKSLVLIELAEHAGQAAALQAGFDHAAGEIYITLDGDGQNDPRDIPALLARLAEGFDLVCGWRSPRRDPALKRIASRAAYMVRSLTAGTGIHDVGCSLRVFRKKSTEGICLWGGLHRFFDVIMAKRGCRIGEVRVTHHPRKNGVSKYGIWDRLKEGAGDLLRLRFGGAGYATAHARPYKIKCLSRTAPAA